jgi:hypothetical protein
MHTKGSLFKWAFFYDCKYSMRFSLYTLVDITETGARKGDDPKPLRQQQNFLTVLQTIGLRVNPTYIKPPVCKDEIPSKIGLGSSFKQKEKVWEFVFDIEYENALDLETLVNDFNLIPVISGLDETADFENSVFISKNPKINNIVFELDDK